ncbi:hypothetical protein BH10PSE7_BH10PSE7_37850 [soil metagenome]
MALSKKQIVSLSVVAGWAFAWAADPLITIFRLNIETWAASKGYDKLYLRIPWPMLQEWAVTIWSWFGIVYETATGPVGLSFAIGGLIFTFWDPVARYSTRLIRRKSNLVLGESSPEQTFYDGGRGTVRQSLGISIGNLSEKRPLRGIEVSVKKLISQSSGPVQMGVMTLTLLDRRSDAVFDLGPKSTKFIGLLAIVGPKSPPPDYVFEQFFFGPVGTSSEPGAHNYVPLRPDTYLVELSATALELPPVTKEFSFRVNRRASVLFAVGGKIPPEDWVAPNQVEDHSLQSPEDTARETPP